MTKQRIKICLALTSLLVIVISTHAFAVENNNLSDIPASASAQSTETTTTVVSPAASTAVPKQQEDTATPITKADIKPTEKVDTASKAPTTKEKPQVITVAPKETAVPAADLKTMEQQVVEAVNRERAAVGLPELKVNSLLSGVAEKKAEDLRDQNYFAHQSPTYGSPFDMLKQFSIVYSAAGENLAKGHKTVEEVMNGWMNSPGHKANILNTSYTEIGVGYITDSNGTTYWVQHFIRP